MKRYKIVIMLLLSVWTVVAASSANSIPKEIKKVSNSTATKMEGKALHEKACTKCHDSSVYTRANRKIKSLDSLEKRVRGCNANTGANLFPEELNAVSTFLNSEYYKF